MSDAYCATLSLGGATLTESSSFLQEKSTVLETIAIKKSLILVIIIEFRGARYNFDLFL
ncbi:hypothetical protein D9M72_594730 [compost metagenome]